MDSPRIRKEELLYLRAGFRRSPAEVETRQIANKNLKTVQAERNSPKELRAWLYSPPLVLKLTREKVDHKLNCFLETKVTESYRRRLKSTAPRFVEDGDMVVKVVLNNWEKRRKRRKQATYPKSYLQHLGIVEDSGLALTAQDQQRLRRIKASLDLSLQREYRKDQAAKTFEERNQETRLFLHRNL